MYPVSVLAHSVGQRTQEFGIRMALGAQQYQLQLLLMVLGQTIRTLAVGLPLGACNVLFQKDDQDSYIRKLMEKIVNPA